MLTAPTGVSVYSISKSAVTVKWNAATGMTGYTVFYNTKKSLTGAVSINVNKSETSNAVTGLSAGTTYYFCVGAYNNFAEYQYSDWESITLPSSSTTTIVSGCFTNKSDTVAIGEKYYLKGKASVVNGTLGTVTVNVLNYDATKGYPYSEVTKTFSGVTEVKLESYSGTYVFDTSKAPFSTPGTYTINLHVKAADGTYAKVDSMSLTTVSAPVSTTTVSGSFTNKSDTVAIGEKYYLKGKASVVNGTLGTVTVNVLNYDATKGYPYSEVTKTFSGVTEVKLESYSSTYVFDTSKAPFSTPGTYTINLHVKAADGTYKKVDSMSLTTVNKTAQLGKPEYVTIEPCDFVYPSALKSTVQDGTEYDQTGYPLASGKTWNIPFTTGKNVLRATCQICSKDSSGNWTQYGSLKQTKSFSSGNSGHSETFSMTLPSDMPTGIYLVRVFAKNIDSEDPGDYVTVKAKITVNSVNSGYGAAEVSARMDDLYNKLGGPGFFTVDHKSCTSSFEKGHSCDNCSNERVLNATWFKNIFGTISTSSFPTSYRGSTEYTQKGWSCLGFSHFAEYWLYRDPKSPNSKVSTRKIGTYTFNQTNAEAYAHTGDLIGFDSSHSAICYYSNSSGMYVLDCNWGVGGNQCRVDKHYIPYSKYANFTIARATNAE